MTLKRLELVDAPSDLPLPVGFEHIRKLVRFTDAGQARTDATGTATFSGLSPGRYQVAALPADEFLAELQAIEVTAAEVEVVLTCRLAVEARVEVVDPDGAPVANAKVTLLQAPARRSAETDEQGIAVLANLDPDWDTGLRVRPPPELELFESRLDQWRIRDARIVLERSLSVSGRVVNERGEPVPHAHVYQKWRGDSWKIFRAGPDGGFRIGKLRDGQSVTLKVEPPGFYGTSAHRVVTVEAGTHDLVVVLPRGSTQHVVVRNWPKDAKGTLRLTSARDRSSFWTAEIRADGRCSIGSLNPETPYVLWGTLRDDDRFLYQPEVRVSDEPLALHLRQGEGIDVRVKVPEGVSLRGVSAYGLGVRRRVGVLDPNARWHRIPGLPPGRWTVQALGSSLTRMGAPPKSWLAEMDARPGETVEFTLQPVGDD